MTRIPRKLAGIGAYDLMNSAAFDTYVGPSREVVVDPVRKIIALHDGTTPGGAQFAANAVLPENLSEVAFSGQYSDLLGLPTLATVATSGSYLSLSNRPTLGTAAAADVDDFPSISDVNALSSQISAINTRSVSTRAAMLALPANIIKTDVKDAARGGDFDWTPGDQSALVTADLGAIGVVPPTATPNGSAGVWIWRKMPRMTPRRAGAVGDTNGNNSSPDDWLAMQRSMNWAAANGIILEIDRPYRIGNVNKGKASNIITFANQLTTPSNLAIEGKPDGLILPVGFSASGSIITNLRTAADPLSRVSNIRISGLNIDMIDYQPFVLKGTIQSATSTTVTLPAVDDLGNPVSTVDNFYNNLVMQIVDGPGVTEYVYLKNYNGATRTATLAKPDTSTNWDTPPTSSSKFELGLNDNAFGFSGGASDVKIDDCVVKNVLLGILNAGGKAFNAENGADRVIVTNLWGYNIGGALLFAQGHPGTNANGSKRWVRNITFRDCGGIDCGALIAALSLDGATDPDGDPDDNLSRFENTYGERCGHMDQRPSTEKAHNGAIILGEAGNAIIRNTTVDNGSWTPTYTTDPYRVGYGLSGNPHLIKGWGRNIEIDTIRAFGNFRSLHSIERARAFGDDAGQTPDVGGSGKPQNVYRVRIKNIMHQGTTTLQAITVSSNSVLRPLDIEVRIVYEDIRVNDSSRLVFDPNMAGYTGILMRNAHDWLPSMTAHKEMSAAQFIACGNTIAAAALEGGQKVALTAVRYTAYEITPPHTPGIFCWRIKAGSSFSSGVAGRVSYSTTGAAQCESLGIGANVVLGTAALTTGSGTDVDTKLNVASVLATGKVMFKNMLAADRDFEYWFE